MGDFDGAVGVVPAEDDACGDVLEDGAGDVVDDGVFEVDGG